MVAPPQQDVTGLLQAWRRGDRTSLERLVHLLYAELHRVAHRCLGREQPGHLLQTSALVNEAYLRLVDANQIDWRDRAHFLAVCAKLMRQVLIQYARSRDAGKRGGRVVRVTVEDAFALSPERDADLIYLDAALNRLAKADPRQAKVVELRFFGGLSEVEAAHVLGVSERTVRRDWDHAKVWLFRELRRGA